MSNETWFQHFQQSKHYSFLQKRPVAYFCIEYALSDAFPTYAGGLGVLAGDYVREMADQKVPSIAIGLYYQSKFGAIDVLENPKNPLTTFHPEKHSLIKVEDSNGKPLLISVPIHNRNVYAKVWLWNKGTIPVYLLDTNVPENTNEDRTIGYKLYDSNKETRLKQEIVLGIGGYRLLKALGIQPSIYHMNEGHSALLGLEILAHEMKKRNIGFHDALHYTKHHIVFTNHTLLPAGNEIFNLDLFTYVLSSYASSIEIPVTDISALGMIHDSSSFSMSLFALRMAGKINAVSRLHAKEAEKVWTGFPIEYITNGIHIPTWDAYKDNPSDFPVSHKTNKKNLLDFIHKKTGLSWKEDALLIGWARRIVRYKRPLAIFDNIQRLQHLIAKKPLRILIAGIAHQGDNDGREMMQEIQNVISNNFAGTAYYIPEYNKTIATMVTRSCDIWLNTPVVGSEACGTSAMKASLNGVLPCTTKDGWIDEIDATQIGWLIDSETIQESLLDTLENDVIPAYYSANREEWETFRRNGRTLILDKFSTTRMIKEYFEKIYLPVLNESFTHYVS